MVADPLSFDGGEAVEFKDVSRRASIDDLKEIEDIEERGRRGKLEEDVGGTQTTAGNLLRYTRRGVRWEWEMAVGNLSKVAAHGFSGCRREEVLRTRDTYQEVSCELRVAKGFPGDGVRETRVK